MVIVPWRRKEKKGQISITIYPSWLKFDRKFVSPLFGSCVSIHWAVRHFTAKSRFEIRSLKAENWLLWWSYRSEIWQASRQYCCQGACQISGDWKSLNLNLAASRLGEQVNRGPGYEMATNVFTGHDSCRVIWNNVPASSAQFEWKSNQI